MSEEFFELLFFSLEGEVGDVHLAPSEFGLIPSTAVNRWPAQIQININILNETRDLFSSKLSVVSKHEWTRKIGCKT